MRSFLKNYQRLKSSISTRSIKYKWKHQTNWNESNPIFVSEFWQYDEWLGVPILTTVNVYNPYKEFTIENNNEKQD